MPLVCRKSAKWREKGRGLDVNWNLVWRPARQIGRRQILGGQAKNKQGQQKSRLWHLAFSVVINRNQHTLKKVYRKGLTPFPIYYTPKIQFEVERTGVELTAPPFARMFDNGAIELRKKLKYVAKNRKKDKPRFCDATKKTTFLWKSVTRTLAIWLSCTARLSSCSERWYLRFNVSVLCVEQRFWSVVYVMKEARPPLFSDCGPPGIVVWLDVKEQCRGQWL